MKTVRISKWHSGEPIEIGIASLPDEYPLAETAQEACGIAAIIADARAWSGPSDYECGGDEVYEIDD